MHATPIIPWLGGKRRLADKLIPLFPPHDCYVEVFCGGAALYFLRPVPAHTEVINDINGELVNLYRVVQHHLDEFLRQFQWVTSGRQLFTWHQSVPLETLTDIQRAARFYFLQQHAFSGKIVGQHFGTATTAPAFNLCQIKDTLAAAHQRLGGTFVENLPWLTCMKRYDRPHSFFYCDPPYWLMAGYGVEFGLEQYEQLADFMRTCQGKVMVSINDHPEMRRVFDGLHIVEVDIKYCVGTSHGSLQMSKELVITNWDIRQCDQLF